MEEPEFKVGTKNPTKLVDAVIATVVYEDPSRLNTLPTLENLTHTTHVVAKDGINIQPYLEDVHKENKNLCQSKAISKPMGILEDPGPRIVAPIFQHSEIYGSPN